VDNRQLLVSSHGRRQKGGRQVDRCPSRALELWLFRPFAGSPPGLFAPWLFRPWHRALPPSCSPKKNFNNDKVSRCDLFKVINLQDNTHICLNELIGWNVTLSQTYRHVEYITSTGKFRLKSEQWNLGFTVHRMLLRLKLSLFSKNQIGLIENKIMSILNSLQDVGLSIAYSSTVGLFYKVIDRTQLGI